MTVQKLPRGGVATFPIAVIAQRIAKQHEGGVMRTVPAAIVAFTAVDSGEPVAICVEQDGSVFGADLAFIEVVEPLEHPLLQTIYRAVFTLDDRLRGRG